LWIIRPWARLWGADEYLIKPVDKETLVAAVERSLGRRGLSRPAGPILVVPWFQGTYDAVILGFTKRMNMRFALAANYTWMHEIDNALHSSFVSDLQTGLGAAFASANGPTDSFVGMTSVVTDPSSGQTNASGTFTAANGNPVPKAGVFYNGPDLDKGPSDLGA
jgi:hypothetical protein